MVQWLCTLAWDATRVSAPYHMVGVVSATPPSMCACSILPARVTSLMEHKLRPSHGQTRHGKAKPRPHSGWVGVVLETPPTRRCCHQVAAERNLGYP